MRGKERKRDGEKYREGKISFSVLKEMDIANTQHYDNYWQHEIKTTKYKNVAAESTQRHRGHNKQHFFFMFLLRYKHIGETDFPKNVRKKHQNTYIYLLCI